MKRFAPLFLFLLIGVAFAYALTRDPRKLDSVIIDQPFPDFALTGLYEPEADTTQEILRGHVSLVNVFGSWCVACTYEHPVLMDIAEDKAVKIIGINWRDDRAKGKKWLADYGDPYDVIVYDPDSLLAIPLGVVGAPETFVTDHTGRIRYKHTGPITPDVWKDTLYPLILRLETEA